MDNLTGTQRKYLRGLAHSARPLVHIGQHGLSAAVVQQLDQALESHELIKVKYLTDDREGKAALTTAITEQLRAEPVGAVGHTAIFYRRHHDPEKRKVKIPR
jgi:RNA-binding protein